VPLIETFVSQGASRTDYGGSLGVQFQFTGLTGGQVTELGIYNANDTPGLKTNHLLSLYALSDPLDFQGTLLSSVTILASENNSGATNTYLYTPLPLPVPLTNGAHYVVVADYPTTHSVDAFLNIPPDQSTSQVATEFISRFADSTGNPGSFVPTNGFPNAINPPLSAYAGPNLRIIPVAEAPGFKMEPNSVTAYEGHTVKLAAELRGSPPLSYQWQGGQAGGPYFNLSDRARVSGAKTPTLTIRYATTNDNPEYRLVVTNELGAVTSRVASITLVSVPAELTNAHAFSEAILAREPIAYWRLNDAPSAELIFDSAGNHDARSTNVAFGVGGLRAPAVPGFSSNNTAAYFDGFSSAVMTGSTLLNGLDQFSVLGWFSPGGPNTSDRTGLFGQNDAFELGFNDIEGVVLWFPTGFNWFKLVSGPEGFTTDEWYFVAVVASADTVTLYVNGVQRAQIGGAAKPLSNFGFNIGGNGIFDDRANHFNGRMEDVAVFDTALSRTEVQRLYGAGVGFFPPIISADPQPTAAMEGGTVVLSVEAEGGGLSYLWKFGPVGGPYVNLVDGDRISGATTNQLTITNVSLADAGEYIVTVSNQAGSTSSNPGRLTILPSPAPGSYAAVVQSMNPVAYWRFDETEDPAEGNLPAFDSAGPFHGVYGTNVRNGNANYQVAGPRPSDGFMGFEMDNKAIELSSGVNDCWITVPSLNIDTNMVSIIAWIKPRTNIQDFASLFFSRGAGEEIVGLNFGAEALQNGQMLTYTWTSTRDTWTWITQVKPKTGVWSFVSMTLTTNYCLMSHDGVPFAYNIMYHSNQTFSGTTRIGTDPIEPLARTFNGMIDEVAVFNYELTGAQLKELYHGPTRNEAKMSISTRPDGTYIVHWDRPGNLESTALLAGTNTSWTLAGTNSPVVITNISAAQFFRVRKEE
jgi:hypothetical protein